MARFGLHEANDVVAPVVVVVETASTLGSFVVVPWGARRPPTSIPSRVLGALRPTCPDRALITLSRCAASSIVDRLLPGCYARGRAARGHGPSVSRRRGPATCCFDRLARQRRALACDRPMRPGATGAYWKMAIEAVKPWTALRPPTGPSSPAQNIPATAEVPSRSPTTMASWSGVPDKWPTAPIAREHERATGGTPRSTRRASPRRRWPHPAPGTARSNPPQGCRPPRRDRATIDAEHAPDEEIAALELVLAFVDDDTAVQALFGELTVAGWQPLERGE